MKLVDNAPLIASRAWSMRLIYISTILGAIDVALPYFEPEQPTKWFGILSLIVGASAGIARMIAQPGMIEAADDDTSA